MDDDSTVDAIFYLGQYTGVILQLDAARGPGERWRELRELLYDAIRETASSSNDPSAQPETNFDEFGDDIDRWIEWMQEHNEGARSRIVLPSRTDKSNTQ